MSHGVSHTAVVAAHCSCCGGTARRPTPTSYAFGNWCLWPLAVEATAQDTCVKR